MKKELSSRQTQILDFVKAFTKKNGYPPSVREIGKAVGLSSSSTVHGHLTTLESAGILKRDASKPRALGISSDSSSSNTIDIPLVGSIAAGVPILAEENIEDYYTLPTEFINNSGINFMLEVKGDSMIGAGILEGDYIVVKKQADAKDGEIIVALVGDDEATVKRFFKEKDHIRLQPENKQFDPIISKDVNVLGKVVGVFRSL